VGGQRARAEAGARTPKPLTFIHSSSETSIVTVHGTVRVRVGSWVRYHVSSGSEKRGVVRMNGGGAAARQRRACVRTPAKEDPRSWHESWDFC
jgi:hypothetical protein